MNDFEKSIIDNLDLYRELTEKYTLRKINLDPVEMLKKVNDLKDKTRGDKLNTYKFDDNNYLYDSNFYFVGNKGIFDIQGLIYVSNNKEAEVIKKYNIGLGQYKRNIVDITQEISIDEKIEDFMIRNYKTRDQFDEYTYKYNSQWKARGIKKQGDPNFLRTKDSYGEIKYNDEVYQKEREKIEQRNEKFAEQLMGQFGLDKLPEQMNQIGEVVKELDKNISSVGNNVNNTLTTTLNVFEDVEEKIEDVVDDIGGVIDDIGGVIDDIGDVVGQVKNRKSKIDEFSDYIRFFFKSIISILNAIIKLTKMGFKITELIIIISPILVIVYTFYKINLSLYNINDYGKEERNKNYETS